MNPRNWIVYHSWICVRLRNIVASYSG